MRSIIAGLVLVPSLLGAQQLRGVVYLDRNANGARDAGEPGVPQVAVSDQEAVVLTDADGTFRIARGRGHGIVYVSIPTGLRAVGSFWKRATDSLAFGLTPDPRTGGTVTFIHASDTHISEQSAPRTRRLRAMVDSIRPAFVLITGDLVRDALRVPETEARGYYDLFTREKGSFATPVFTVPGNHEIFGIETDRSGVSPTHPLFGKTMYRSYLGPDYYSFDAGGVHFVALNTVDIHQSSYHGGVDSLQLAWLARDLDATPAGTPVVTFNHIPFYSAAEIFNGYDDGPPAPTLITINGKTQYRHVVGNARDALAVLAKRRHEVALGGHIHVVERLDYLWEGQRTRFETSAATVAPVNSNGRTFPSGFTVYSITNGVVDAGRFVRLDP